MCFTAMEVRNDKSGKMVSSWMVALLTQFSFCGQDFSPGLIRLKAGCCFLRAHRQARALQFRQVLTILTRLIIERSKPPEKKCNSTETDHGRNTTTPYAGWP